MPPSEDTEVQVEIFMKPVFASDAGVRNWSIGGTLDRGQAPNDNELMCYSLAVIQPPEIPNNVDQDSIKVWEVYRVETEVIVLPKTFSTGYETTSKNIGGVEGPQLYFWSVGGQPLDVIGVPARTTIVFPNSVVSPAAHDVVQKQSTRRQITNQKFPIEAWVADPSRNENCKYFGRVIGGNMSPPVVTYSNSSTIPVLDEFGVGVLCLQNKLYVTSADMLGLVGEVEQQTLGPNTSFRRIQAAPARFFRIHFRQRVIKNPYTMSLLYKQVFGQTEVAVEAPQTEVVEVTLVNDDVIASKIEGSVSGVSTNVTNMIAASQAAGTLVNPTPLFNT